jgi:hypothetical protein
MLHAVLPPRPGAAGVSELEFPIKCLTRILGRSAEQLMKTVTELEATLQIKSSGGKIYRLISNICQDLWEDVRKSFLRSSIQQI